MTTGKIVGVNGNMITVAFDGPVAQNEVGQETPAVTQEESGVLCFPSSRALTPRMRLECNPEIAVGPGEEY